MPFPVDRDRYSPLGCPPTDPASLGSDPQRQRGQESGSASISFRVDPNSLMTGRRMILRACQAGATPMSQATLRNDQEHDPKNHSYADMIRIPGGTFRMGSDQH